MLTVLSEQDLARIEESRGIEKDDCLSWHKHCNAECCRMFLIPDNGCDLSKPEIHIQMFLTADQQWYYSLHGARYAHGILRIPTKNCRREGKHIVVHRDCDYLLPDLRCKGHPHSKPLICSQFTYDRVVDGTAKGTLTKNCLFKYKMLSEERT